MDEVVVPAPVPVERVPTAGAPVMFSELAEERMAQAWAFAGGALGVLALGLAVVAVAVIR